MYSFVESKFRGGKKSPNPLVHPNPLFHPNSLNNCPTKALIGLLIGRLTNLPKSIYWSFEGIFVIFIGIFIILEVVRYFDYLHT